jgi:hypothetical protein
MFKFKVICEQILFPDIICGSYTDVMRLSRPGVSIIRNDKSRPGSWRYITYRSDEGLYLTNGTCILSLKNLTMVYCDFELVCFEEKKSS